MAERSGQGGGDRRWEQVGRIEENEPEAAGKLGRGVPDREPEFPREHPVGTPIERNVDKGTEKVDK
jgi:hypothetical protein